MSASKRTEFIGSDGRDEEARIVKRSALVSFNRVTRAFICAWLSVCLAVTTWACEWRKSRRVEDRCSIKKVANVHVRCNQGWGCCRGGADNCFRKVITSFFHGSDQSVYICTIFEEEVLKGQYLGQN